MSSVTIAAIAVLESPRSPPDKPKSYIFDGQLWLDSERPLVAGFRYFNTNNDTFGEAPICCMIVANIARYSEKLFPALYSLLDKGDYDIIGDIVYLIPLPDGTDPRHAPYVHVAGTVEHSNGSECFINSSAHLIGIETSENLSFPVTGYFPDSPRYKHGKKPVPRERTITAFGGWLTGTTGRSEHMAPETFRAQVESVAFLGHSAQVVPHPFQTESSM
ncbi:hypothetical protein BDY19DRAFT_679904 [Irpex rosettiformis]|uniref:Uncharacterized protein n=1 Tax=Irpex rosettiformis TaxID=378272 RepID=A0ACB8U9S5_9APHY|nr:hypothetical protein BDY19DRAFT_679904 [Irpex rosettiformis]